MRTCSLRGTPVPREGDNPDVRAWGEKAARNFAGIHNSITYERSESCWPGTRNEPSFRCSIEREGTGAKR